MNTDELFFAGYNLPAPLSKQEIYQLLEKAKEKDQEAVEKIIKHNIRLVISRVNTRFKNYEYEKKDLIAIGNIGLLMAVYNFDVSKNVEFSSYAVKCIDNEILMFIRKNQNRLSEISLDETLSIDSDGNEAKLEDTLSSDINIQEEHELNEIYLQIRNVINNLPELEREIIIMHFGFFGNRRYTQKEIGEKFNISQSYASRKIDKIVKKIACELESINVIEQRKTSTNKKVKKKVELTI